MGCVEGKKCEIRARQERNFEHGAEKREGLGASTAPFLSYGTKYIQACECAEGGTWGPKKNNNIHLSVRRLRALLFCAPVFSLRRVFDKSKLVIITRELLAGVNYSLARPPARIYIFFTLWRGIDGSPTAATESCSISFPSLYIRDIQKSACSFTGNLSQH
jgi:hypothetical protein